MSLLLRKISRSKWQPNMELQPADYSADAITGCTRTSENTLSVWIGESQNFQSPEVEKLVVALASAMPQPATIDLVWLSSDWLANKGIEIVESDGDSKLANYNCHHRDLANLTHEKLSLVGEHIVNQLSEPANYKRFKKNELVNLVDKWVNNEFPELLYELGGEWQEAIKKEREKKQKSNPV
ncbi:TPA: hypothetical protein RRF16_004310 [Klebsiella pneumoniae]|nr:hypothetical protein [Klebsiella pneumoniae]